MNKYNGLLQKISQQYNIKKGKHERNERWKTRIVYSICGLMAYASLWDRDEEGEGVSIIHVKKRIHETFCNYKLLYPEIITCLPVVFENLDDEIVDLFCRAGIVYHSPNRIYPSMKRSETFCGIKFQRGISVGNIKNVSGLGLYSNTPDKKSLDDLSKIRRMFRLEENTLQDIWKYTISTNTWHCNQTLTSQKNVEYIRLHPPFYSGYWTRELDTSGAVSILRVGPKGNQEYYLYRYAETGLETSPLQYWKVNGKKYRELSNACLAYHEELPPIEYCEDGEVVYVDIGYLPPLPEHSFLKLYSWPISDFRRVFSLQVFAIIKSILSDEGYTFKKGEYDGNWRKFYS